MKVATPVLIGRAFYQAGNCGRIGQSGVKGDDLQGQGCLVTFDCSVQLATW